MGTREFRGVIYTDKPKPHIPDYPTFVENIQRRFPEWYEYQEEFAEQYTRFLYKIMRLRVKRGKSQKDMAMAMGTSQSNIGKLEAGNMLPSIFWLRKYLDVLGYKLQFRVAPKDPQEPNEKEDQS